MNLVLSLFFGFTVLYLMSWLIIALFIFVYTKISHKAKVLSGNILPLSALLALVNVLLINLSLVLFSSNEYLYLFLTFSLVAVSFYLIVRRYKKQELIDAVILAVGMALILSPGWLGFLGIL